MANLIKQTDFVGKYQMTKNTKASTKFQNYILKFQKKWIYKILGAELGKAFLADLDANGVPVDVRFTEIYNAFAFDDDCSVRESIGMKEIILGLVCWEIKRDFNIYNSLGGNKRTEGENSEFVDVTTNITAIGNESIESAKNVQWYIQDYNPTPQDYSDFNGQDLNYFTNF